jgi:hypothetical protein
MKKRRYTSLVLLVRALHGACKFLAESQASFEPRTHAIDMRTIRFERLPEV